MKTTITKLMTMSLTLGLAACAGQVDKSLENEINSAVGVSSEKLLASTAVSALANENLPAVCVPEVGTITGGTLSINDGAPETTSPLAVLSLGGLPEILRMKISNDVNCECGDWEFYSPTKQWALEPVDGVATVGVQYKDYEGRVTQCVSATIRFPTPTTTTTLPPVVTTTTLPPETTTTTLPPVVTTTTLPPETTTTTLPPVVTTTTLPPVVTTTTMPPVVTTTTVPPVVTTTTLPPVVTTTTMPPVVTTTTVPPVVTTTTMPENNGVSQDYVVNSSNKKVDILIIDDNSGSMRYEQKSMAKRMSTFLSQLKGLDWRVAITTTDPRHSVYGDGRLLEMKGLSGKYYISSDMDSNMAQKILGDTIQRKETGSSSEQGIYTTYRSVERAMSADSNRSCQRPYRGCSKHHQEKYEKCISNERNPNKEFFRSDANFAVIVISDENESAHGMKNKPENLVKFVKANYPNKLFNFHSIVTRTGDVACLRGEGASYGTVYENMSRLTGHGSTGGSIIGSVCEADYGSQLSGISASCQNMQKVIPLKCAPIGNVSSSVRVQLNGVYYNGAYTVQGDRLVFTNYLPAGSYNLQYRCQ